MASERTVEWEWRVAEKGACFSCWDLAHALEVILTMDARHGGVLREDCHLRAPGHLVHALFDSVSGEEAVRASTKPADAFTVGENKRTG